MIMKNENAPCPEGRGDEDRASSKRSMNNLIAIEMISDPNRAFDPHQFLANSRGEQYHRPPDIELAVLLVPLEFEEGKYSFGVDRRKLVREVRECNRHLSVHSIDFSS